MNDYFEVMTIAENVYQIYEPGGVGSALVIGGEKALLIDTVMALRISGKWWNPSQIFH